MLARLKKVIKSRLYNTMTEALDHQAARARAQELLQQKSSPATQVALQHLFQFYRQAVSAGQRFQLADVGLQVFSQFEEDGLLLYLFAALGIKYRRFVDIGSGDGINSNCANWAVNFGWHGLFIDGDVDNIERGRRFYKDHPGTWLYPPVFIPAYVQRENINELIRKAGAAGPIDLLSIDIDGNDYWIWEALEAVDPRVVIIETHVEFGMHSIVVPYDKDYCYPGKHPDYHGASPVAMAKLAARKGYRLVGANQYGFNTIYVKNGVGDTVVPGVSVESILAHPRNRERQKLFEPIKDWMYVNV